MFRYCTSTVIWEGEKVEGTKYSVLSSSPVLSRSERRETAVTVIKVSILQYYANNNIPIMKHSHEV